MEEPENAAARRQVALLLARDNRLSEAEALVQDGLRRRPAHALLQQTLVALAQQARGVDAALGIADQLARQASAQPASRTLRGDFLLAQRRPTDAAAAFAAAYAEAPSSVLALRQASAWHAAGQPARATATLEEWLRREPESVEALDMLAQLDIQAGRTATAERRLSVVVERAPMNAQALNNLAWILTSRGDVSSLLRARSLAERAYFLLPSAQTADTLGWALARSGEVQSALPLLRQATAATNAGERPDSSISYRLAVALRAAGEREEAMRVLEPVLARSRTFPERAEAERLLAELRGG
jgi:tetratricopeptide (TPR) repeat protein